VEAGGFTGLRCFRVAGTADYANLHLLAYPMTAGMTRPAQTSRDRLDAPSGGFGFMESAKCLPCSWLPASSP